MLTPQETAEKLGVTTQTVRNFIKQGKLAYIKIGGRYRIEERTVDALLTPHNEPAK